MLSLFPVLAVSLAASAADPLPVAARIDEVTVYGSQAMVRRAATLAGRGPWVIQGLPITLDPESLRVQSRGGDVVDVEVRQRLREASATPRVQALREEIDGLRRELERLGDRMDVGKTLIEHFKGLLAQEAEAHRREVGEGRPSPEAWQASLDFAREGLEQVKRSQRELAWQQLDVQRSIERLEVELGTLQGEAQVPVYDVVVDAVPSGADPIALTLDTFLHGAGWNPVYDLRTASDLSGTELVYRARVWQQTGEDWDDVALSLSTAQPQMGAQAPEPPLTWVEIFDPQQKVGRAAPTAARELDGLGYSGDDTYLGREEAKPASPSPFASVLQEGLSVRFTLPRRETVESRNDPTTVLVGNAKLAIAPERYSVPEQVETVWLRAKAKNTSEWTLLPGRAAVFFGNDFLGHAQIETVQPGQELTLHLGADPAVTVKRELVVNEDEAPGFLSSRAGKLQRWRVHFENHGAVGARPDGSVDVIFQEALPRSRDDRLTVALSDAKPKPSDDERWKKEREEKSVYTWIVRIPRGGEANVVFDQKLEFPKGLQVREHF